MPLPKTLLQKYPAINFVETGTFQGEGVLFASQYNYRAIHSIEADVNLARDAKDKFQSSLRINIWQGKSEDLLPSVISRLQGSITFWLDAHMESNLTATNCPVLKELACITPILTDRKVNVLIDDWRLMSDDLREKIQLYVANLSNVKSGFEDTHIAAADIFWFTYRP
jgi:hypothetical protein